jgi:hypothetical protein
MELKNNKTDKTIFFYPNLGGFLRFSSLQLANPFKI